MPNKPKNKFDNIVETLYPLVERKLRDRGYNASIAPIIVKQLAYESNYGTEPTGKFNLAGMKHSGQRMKNFEYVIGPKDTERYASFNSYSDAIDFYLDNTASKWPDALKAGNIDEYVELIHPKNDPHKQYSTTPVDQYKSTMNGLKSLDKAIAKFTASYDPADYADYKGEVEMERFGKSKYITDDSIQRMDGYQKRSTGVGNDTMIADNPYQQKSYHPDISVNDNGMMNYIPNQTMGVDPSMIAQNNVDTSKLNFNYQPKETASDSYSFSKGQTKVPKVQKTPEQVEQEKALSKQREQEFNFKGTPTLGSKKGLVDAVFEEGGNLTEFNEGGLHEENVNGGIRQGINDAGTFNLVEEGETKYNDYIFSNKFFLSKEDLELARLDPNMEGMTIAEGSKHLNRFLDEAPFDKITRDTVNEQLDNLILINEKYKEDDALREQLFGMPENPSDYTVEGIPGEQIQPGMEDINMSPEAMMNPEEPMFADGGFTANNSGFFSRFRTKGENEALANGEGINTMGAVTGALGLAGGLMNNLDTSGISADGLTYTDPTSISQGKMAATGALTGAASGAAIGSAVPVVGTAIGAVGGALVGGIGGLIGGNKKKKAAEKSLRVYNDRNFNSGFMNETQDLVFADGGDTKGGPGKKKGKDPLVITIDGVTFEGKAAEFIDSEIGKLRRSGKESEINKLGKKWKHLTISSDKKDNTVKPTAEVKKNSSYSTEPKTVSKTEGIVTPGWSLMEEEEVEVMPEGFGVAMTPEQIAELNEEEKKRVLEEIQYNINNVWTKKPEEIIADEPVVADAGYTYEPETSVTTMGETPIKKPTLNPIINQYGPAKIGALTTDRLVPNVVNTYEHSKGSNTSETDTTVTNFTPRNSTMADALTFAPALGSLMNVLNKEKPEYTNYQLNDFKYKPEYVDEERLINPIRQEASNSLRSLEQSGMSQGSMMAAKLATGANAMNATSNAFATIDEINRGENKVMQEMEYRTNAENTGIINQQIETNLQNKAAADAFNKANMNSFMQNLGAVGEDRRNVNTAYNMSRGYTQSGTFSPEQMNLLSTLFKNNKNIKTDENGNIVQAKGGSLFGESDTTVLLKSLLEMSKR